MMRSLDKNLFCLEDLRKKYFSNEEHLKDAWSVRMPYNWRVINRIAIYEMNKRMGSTRETGYNLGFILVYQGQYTS